MPPRKKANGVEATVLPSSMKELTDTLWKAADKLRGSMDASQYKDVILGLVFLKYVSDAFEERRSELQSELKADGLSEDQIDQLIDDVDEYTGHGVFWVPAQARWQHLAEHAKGLPAMDGQAPKSIGEIRDALLPQFMSGKLKVKDAGGERRSSPGSPLTSGTAFPTSGDSRLGIFAI